MVESTAQRMEVWPLVKQVAEGAEKAFLEGGDLADRRACFRGSLSGMKGDAKEGELFSKHINVALALFDIGMSPLKVADEMRRMGI